MRDLERTLMKFMKLMKRKYNSTFEKSRAKKQYKILIFFLLYYLQLP